MATEENIKNAIRSEDLEGLSPNRLEELRVEVDSALGKDGYTCLHWACHYGKPEVLQHFLNLGASINKPSGQGWTGAHVAAIRGCAICLEILCNSGVDVKLRDKRGYTCAHLAALHGKCNVLQVMVKVGVDLMELDKREWSVLHHAAFHGRLGILQLLLKLSESDSGLEDLESNTPTHLAAAEGQIECLRLLVYHKNQPMDVVNARNNVGSTPKDLAIRFQKQNCVEFLELAETEVDVLGYKDKSEFPAHAAAKEGHLQLLSMLIKEGHCKVNDQDKDGATPAHKAAGNGHSECVQWLIDHGADVTLANNKGETPREVAIRFANTGCIAILAPKTLESNWKGEEEAEMDQPSSISKERAKERVEKLTNMLQLAKTRFRELGGELSEDGEIEVLKKEQERCICDLEAKLLFERERREELEADMDQMRKQLQQSTSLLDKYQSINHQGTTDSTPESTPNHRVREDKGPHKRIKTTRKNNSAGGAFIRIGH